jgi:Ca2+-binding RTX toxin-like protein
LLKEEHIVSSRAAIVVTLGAMAFAASASAAVIDGTDADEALVGTPRSDVIHARAGNDTVSALAGADRVYGEAGVDTLRGGEGRDELDGGDGDDVLYGGAGADMIRTGPPGTGGSCDPSGCSEPNPFLGDVGFGEDGNDTLVASGDADHVVPSLNGGAGRDVLATDGGPVGEHGGAGADRLYGGAGADVLNGDDGDDVIHSEGDAPGADEVDCGAGNDVAYVDPGEFADNCEVVIYP